MPYLPGVSVALYVTACVSLILGVLTANVVWWLLAAVLVVLGRVTEP